MDNLLFYYLLNNIEVENSMNLLHDVLDHVMAGPYSAEIRHCYYQLYLWALRNRDERIDVPVLKTSVDAEQMLRYSERLTRSYPNLHDAALELIRTFDQWGK
jgi:hypothetical protein